MKAGDADIALPKIKEAIAAHLAKHGITAPPTFLVPYVVEPRESAHRRYDYVLFSCNISKMNAILNSSSSNLATASSLTSSMSSASSNSSLASTLTTMTSPIFSNPITNFDNMSIDASIKKSKTSHSRGP